MVGTASRSAVARRRRPWLDHVSLKAEDRNGLQVLGADTLGGQVSDEFFAFLAHLEFLDLRGGSDTFLGVLEGSRGDRVVVYNDHDPGALHHYQGRNSDRTSRASSDYAVLSARWGSGGVGS